MAAGPGIQMDLYLSLHKTQVQMVQRPQCKARYTETDRRENWETALNSEAQKKTF